MRQQLPGSNPLSGFQDGTRLSKGGSAFGSSNDGLPEQSARAASRANQRCLVMNVTAA